MKKQPILILPPGKVYLKPYMQARELRCSLLKGSSIPQNGLKENFLAPLPLVGMICRRMQ